MKRKIAWLGFALLGLLMISCGPLNPLGLVTGLYSTNGERIFLTGTSANGRISYTGGNLSGGMMGGGRLACASCHGADGRGGPHLMHMSAMDATDIRWSTLTEAEHGDPSQEGGMEHPPYDETAFKRAVTQGLDPGGKPLDASMPRWRMSDRDLDDLISYLKTLN
jgi:cytochrome c oxidase subunit 2